MADFVIFILSVIIFYTSLAVKTSMGIVCNPIFWFTVLGVSGLVFAMLCAGMLAIWLPLWLMGEIFGRYLPGTKNVGPTSQWGMALEVLGNVCSEMVAALFRIEAHTEANSSVPSPSLAPVTVPAPSFDSEFFDVYPTRAFRSSLDVTPAASRSSSPSPSPSEVADNELLATPGTPWRNGLLGWSNIRHGTAPTAPRVLAAADPPSRPVSPLALRPAAIPGREAVPELAPLPAANPGDVFDPTTRRLGEADRPLSIMDLIFMAHPDLWVIRDDRTPALSRSSSCTSLASSLGPM